MRGRHHPLTWVGECFPHSPLHSGCGCDRCDFTWKAQSQPHPPGSQSHLCLRRGTDANPTVSLERGRCLPDRSYALSTSCILPLHFSLIFLSGQLSKGFILDLVLFETVSYYVVQAGLKLLSSSRPSAPAFHVARMTGAHHCIHWVACAFKVISVVLITSNRPFSSLSNYLILFCPHSLTLISQPKARFSNFIEYKLFSESLVNMESTCSILRTQAKRTELGPGDTHA